MQENKQDKSPIKQKILLYLANKGITPYEFYKISGVTRGILQQNNGISEDNISRFLAYAPDVNLEWLMLGKGEMLKTECISSTQEENKTSNVVSYDEDKKTTKQQLSPEYMALLSAFQEQATEIGRLQQRIDDLERERGSSASGAHNSRTAIAG